METPMRLTVRTVLADAAAWLPTLLVLALLGGIGWWGATHDWKLGGKPDEEDKEKTKQEGEKKDVARLRLVKLDEDAARDAGVKDEPAKEQTLEEVVTATGEVDYDQNRLAHLGSRVAGTVWSIEKQAGDRVSRGEVLALISSMEVGKIKADFLHDVVEYQLRSKLYERMQAAGGSVPERQVREAEAQMREAHIRLIADQQALLNLGLEVHLDEVQKMTDEQLAQHLRVVGLPPAVLRREKVATLTSNLVPITSPFDGEVVRRELVVGEQVDTRHPYFTVADLRHVWVMLNVRLEDVPRVRLGQEVTFQTEGLKEEVPPGKVTWISAEVDDKTHTLAVRAAIELEEKTPSAAESAGTSRGYGRLRPHSFGNGRIVISRHKGITVPREAVQTLPAETGQDKETLEFVFIRGKESEYEPRKVEIGLRREGFVELVSGVKAGEPVVTAGSHRLKAEMRKERIASED
jgi:cobalt-zinc-cadmium efflux system membrane fusion protein